MKLLLDPNFQDWVLDPTDDRDHFWSEWIAQDPQRQQDVDQAKALMKSIGFQTPVSGLDEKAVFQKIKAGIQLEELSDELNLSREGTDEQVDDTVEETVIYSLPVKGSSTRWLYRIAATLALIIASTATYFYYFVNSTETYTTAFGETKEVTLPDGSFVVLNANSTLSLDPSWPHDERRVELTGEAYFSVIHTENDQKFIVRSNHIEVEVLGTEFNLNNRRGTTQVVLESGEVKINLPAVDGVEKTVMMAPGDLVEVSEKDNKITKKVTNTRVYSSWKNGELIFNGVPLDQVFETIQDRYGYDVIVKGEEIENMLFEAEIQSTDLDLVLRVISRSFNLSITKNNNEIMVEKR